MIDLKLTDEQLDELHREATENPCRRARKKCWVVHLKGMGYAHQEIADVVPVEGDTVTADLRRCRDGGLPGLLAGHYHQRAGPWEAHAERWMEVFEQRPPSTYGLLYDVRRRKMLAVPAHETIRQTTLLRRKRRFVALFRKPASLDLGGVALDRPAAAAKPGTAPALARTGGLLAASSRHESGIVVCQTAAASALSHRSSAG